MVRRIAFAAAACMIAAVPFAASAATLAIAPSAVTAAAGTNFSVDVIVSSPDEAINAASGVLSFPSNEIQAVGIHKDDSIMTFWVQNPSFSNAASGGTANFAGVLLNPGWTGSAGTVITVEFRALAPGSATIWFATGTVLANDGNGTDVLTAMSPATITIVPAPPAPATTSSTPTTTTAATTTVPPPTAPVVAGSAPPPLPPPPLTLEYIAIALLVVLFIIAVLLFLIVLSLWLRRSTTKKGAGARDREQLRDDLKHVVKDIERLEKDLVDPKE